MALFTLLAMADGVQGSRWAGSENATPPTPPP